jgi:hypothetical protein
MGARTVLRLAPARRRRRRGIVAGLRAHHLRQPQLVETAMGHQALGYARALATVAENIASLEAALTAAFQDHPDAPILVRFPGLGPVLGAHPRRDR